MVKSFKMFRFWFLILVVTVADSMAHSNTESSSSSNNQDVILSGGWNNIQHVQVGGCGNDVLNVTLTILDLLQNQDPCCNTQPISVTGRPRDCAEILAGGVNTSGIYPIYPDGAGDPFFVSCDMETDGGGWTVFQRREDGSVDFYLDWLDYKYGFGSVTAEHWLGNDNIHQISTQKTYELRVDLEDFDGNTRYASYDGFLVANENNNYTLTLGAYSGNAGDGLNYHSGRPFSTRDRDNDDYPTSCAIQYTGAWWYGRCYNCNLNGQYLHGQTVYTKGVAWNVWLGFRYSLKKTEMKIRPV